MDEDIEKIREELNSLIKKYNNEFSEEVLLKSRELDELLVKYIKLKERG